MSIEKLMAGVEVEGAIPEDETNDQNNNEQETETSEASPAETKLTEEAPSQEGAPDQEAETEEAQAEPEEADGNIPDETNNLPFNKHPRFKEVIEEKNYFKERTERLEAQIQQLQETVKPLTEAAKPAEQVKIPKFLADVYGEDPEVYAEFVNEQRRIAQAVLDERSRQEQQEREQYQTAKQKEEAYISEQFKIIEDQHGVRLDPGTSERNEFTKFYIENPISKFDDEGKPVYDIVGGYNLFKRIKAAESAVPSPTTQKKKAIASQTIDRTATAPIQSGLTSEQKSRMSFSELAAQALRDQGLFN